MNELQNQVYRLQNIVQAQEEALLHWRRAYDALVAENKRKAELNTRLNARYAALRSALHTFGASLHGYLIEPTPVRLAIETYCEEAAHLDALAEQQAGDYMEKQSQ